MNYLKKLQNKKKLKFLINVSVKTVLILSLFILPQISKADNIINCSMSDNNYDSIENGTLVGTVLSTSGTMNQNGIGYIDCISYTDSPFYNWTQQIDLSRNYVLISSSVNFINGGFMTATVYDSTGLALSTIGGADTYIRFDAVSLVNGIYNVLVDSNQGGDDPIEMFSYYIKDEKIYENINDIPVSSSEVLAPAIGSLNFGLAVVIVLISLGSIFSMYNLISKKRKPWQI